MNAYRPKYSIRKQFYRPLTVADLSKVACWSRVTGVPRFKKNLDPSMRNANEYLGKITMDFK